jgi:haloalkane dehalogenase
MSNLELAKGSEISAADPHPRRRVRVLDTEISFVDVGVGKPIVFLHGNPTASYLWRNIIPYVSKFGRCLAPDLVGMGRSGKSPTNAYRFVDHARYLDAWFEVLGLTGEIILVLHDWGSALGFHRAVRHPTHIKAIAYMEAIASTRRWEDFGDAAEMFRALRSAKGESLIFDQNFFVETVLPRAVIRRLSNEEMVAYRAPFLESAARLPTLIWPRQIPIEGEPADVAAIVDNYSAWISKNAVPKLLVLGDPGAIIAGRTRNFCRSWLNQREITVKGRHFLQEDSPHEIGAALREFVRAVHAGTMADVEMSPRAKSHDGQWQISL